MKKERMKIIIENLIDHLSESLGQNNGEELHNILENGIGMTENEIDYFAGDFSDDEFIGTDVEDKNEYYVIVCDYCVDGESGTSIIGVKEDFEAAQELYNKQLLKEKENAETNDYDTIDENENSFSAYIDGDYMENHIDLYIEEVEEE